MAKPRQYSQRFLRRCARVEQVVLSVAVEAGTLISSGAITAGWRNVHGDAPPARPQYKTWLAPAIERGGVVAKKVASKWLFGPPSMASIEMRFGSNLSLVEEAVRRAVGKHRGAVTMAEVRHEIDDDSELTLASAAGLGGLLAKLVGEGRVTHVHLGVRGGATSRYYTVPGGPDRISPAVMHKLDRRMAAVKRLWQVCKVPFTTRALREFAESRSGLRVVDDPPYGWTNDLQLLERQGAVRAFRTGDTTGVGRFVRWAPASEWQSLGPDEQRDALESTWADVVHKEVPPPRPYRPAYISRNADTRALFIVARNALLSNETDDVRRRVLAERPLSVRQIRHWAMSRMDLLPPKVLLRNALYEASRIRPGIVEPSLTRVGQVRNRSYYALEESKAGVAYVRFLTFTAEARVKEYEREHVQLERAVLLTASSDIPVSGRVLHARGHSLAAKLQKLIDEGDEVLRLVALLDEEREESDCLMGRLRNVLGGVRTTLERTENVWGTFAGTTDKDLLLDTKQAWNEIEQLAGYPLGTSRELPRWLQNSVSTIRTARPVYTGARPVTTYFDRIDFVCYACSRWGGERLAAFAAKARHAIGGIRSPVPFMEVLTSDELSSHPMAAAALGVFDDPASRAALSMYLEKAVSGAEGDVSGAGVVNAVVGLAPLPFGRICETLSEREHTVLQQLRAASGDRWRVRSTAGRVLRAWNENWSTQRLLGL